MKKPAILLTLALALVLASTLLVPMHRATSPQAFTLTLVLVVLRVAAILLSPGLVAAALALTAGHLLHPAQPGGSSSTGISEGAGGAGRVSGTRGVK